MATPSATDIRIDPAKNRLYVILRGSLSEDQVLDAVDRVIARAGELQPGFTVINDTASFQPTTPKGLEDFGQAHGYLLRAGMGREIHVVDQKRTNGATAQTGRFAVESAGSVMEAETRLDQSLAV